MEFERRFHVRNGTPTAYDVVHVYQPGESQRSKTPLRVADVMRVRDDGDPDNPAWLAARVRKDAVLPAYEAWKKGEELPTDGTPIGAWPGITPDQAAGLKAAGLRSIEEVANANDALMSKIPLPNVRGLKELAANFLAGSDRAKVASALADKDREMAEMREQMEEMRQLLLESVRAAEPDLEADGSEAPRRRGRPPKSDATQAEIA
jgi:hypothetical protein